MTTRGFARARAEGTPHRDCYSSVAHSPISHSGTPPLPFAGMWLLRIAALLPVLSGAHYYVRTLATTGGAFSDPAGLLVSSASDLVVVDRGSSRILAVSSSNAISTRAGKEFSAGNVDGVGKNAVFNGPSGIAETGTGSLWLIADPDEGVLRTLGTISNNSATLLRNWTQPVGVACQKSAKVCYIADAGTHTISFVDLTSSPSRVQLAGVPNMAGSSDGVGTNARFRGPRGLALSNNATLYVADTQNHRIRAVNLTSYTVSTVSPLPSSLKLPSGLAISIDGLYLVIADSGNQQVRIIEISTSYVSLVAGTGAQGFVDGLGNAASFSLSPSSNVAVNSNNVIFISDSGNDVIRLISKCDALPGYYVADLTSAGCTFLPCPVGTYSAMNAPACSPCPEGKYGSSPNLTVCAACPAGSYCPLGSNSSFSCAAGTYSAMNAFACTPCPEGKYGSSPNLADCAACPAGSYCPLGSNSSTNCSLGTYAFEGSATCSNCNPGTFWDPLGSKNSSNCDGPCPAGQSCSAAGPKPCLIGTYSPLGETACLPCPEGYFCPAEAMSAPTICEIGTYNNVKNRSVCLPCSAGTWSDLKGAKTCEHFCPPGNYSETSGATSSAACKSCPFGSYQEFYGRDSCTPCPSGKHGVAEGAVSSAVCIDCTKSQYSLPGSRYCSECINPYYFEPNADKNACVEKGVNTCPSGEYRINYFDACQPLKCDPPWTYGKNVLSSAVLSAGLTFENVQKLEYGCAACPPNTIGSYTETLNFACSPCKPSQAHFCVGGTTKATVNLSFALDAWPTDNFSSSGICPILTAPMLLTPPPPKTLFDLAVSTALTGLKEIDIVILVGCSLAGLIMCVYLIRGILMYCGRKYKISSATKASKALSEAFTHIDYTGASEYTRDGLRPIPYSAFGGFTFGLAIAMWLTFSIANILTYSLYNEVKTPAIKLMDSNINNASKEFKSSDRETAQPSLFVRVTAAGDPGRCSGPIGFNSQGGLYWMMNSIKTCANSTVDDGSIVQFQLDCRNCLVPATSSLNFSLDYSCQSLLIEVGAIDANKVQTAVRMSTADTIARLNPNNVSMNALTSASFTVVPVLSLVNSSFDEKRKLRGYALIAGATERRDRILKPFLSTTGVAIAPEAKFISVGITFELSTLVMVTSETKSKDFFDLFSRILNLNNIFSSASFIFGAIFIIIQIAGEAYEKLAACAGMRGRRAQQALYHSIRKMVQPSSHKLTQPSVADGLKWSRKSDGTDTWYVCDATGESSWELPPGAVLADDDGSTVMISTENPLRAASVEDAPEETASTRNSAAAAESEDIADTASVALPPPDEPPVDNFTGENPLHASSPASTSTTARMSRKARLMNAMSTGSLAESPSSAAVEPAHSSASPADADAALKKSHGIGAVRSNPLVDLALSKVRQIHK